MKYFLPLLMIFGLTQSFAQCNSTEDKMLLIGDSWAFFSWTGDSYNENFNRFGFSDLSCYSSTGLAVNGAEANDYFSDANRKQELIDYVSTHPELEIVHLSLGGNDAMASWNKNMTDAQEDAILSVIMNDIKEIIDTIWFYNPDLDIHISGYDYSNFDETVGTALFPTLHPFYGTWDNMGQPVAAEVNSILAKATQVFADSAAAWDQVSFVNNLGLMQWTYGQTTALSVAPFGTYQPLTAPVPGGYTDYPSPLDALNFGGMDSFHLNNNSYELFIKRHFEEFYWAYFRNADQTFIADDSLNNGWTTSTIFGDDKLELGNDGTSNQIQTILSFNTSDMPNLMKASSASIFIKRTGLTGSNLQPENLYVSIKAGNFGDDIQLDANDFNDFGDANAICCTYGTVEDDGHWLRIDLDAALLPYINRYGTTQIKLYYTIADNDRYFDFSNSIEDIMLDLKLADDPLSVNEIEGQNEVTIYPNPTHSYFTINGQAPITNLTISNLNGQVVKTYSPNANQVEIDANDLAKGLYLIQIETQFGISTQKLVVE